MAIACNNPEPLRFQWQDLLDLQLFLSRDSEQARQNCGSSGFLVTPSRP
ncbi:uncharacterized protein G2W53_022252 [Senna tora]|uniref:Uncharacterized protein n=1 Tax=Senna tora TaxID=362788 RepID=A0A834TKX5_9FABA|nr:uncharacterized protein G2W53_022252 [Senna tora]